MTSREKIVGSPSQPICKSSIHTTLSKPKKVTPATVLAQKRTYHSILHPTPLRLVPPFVMTTTKGEPSHEQPPSSHPSSHGQHKRINLLNVDFSPLPTPTASRARRTGPTRHLITQKNTILIFLSVRQNRNQKKSPKQNLAARVFLIRFCVPKGGSKAVNLDPNPR